jgi:hypothetical protein
MKDWIKSKGYKKGQAVMEYLITYGLALFVILIVLAILVAVVLPSLQAPETCQFTQPGFGCSAKKHALVADTNDNVILLFQLDNQQGKSVELLDVMCTSNAPGNVRKSDLANAAPANFTEQMAAGTTRSFGDLTESDIQVEVPCYNEDGNQVTLVPGSNFNGALAIVYKFTEDVSGAPSRLAVATLTGSVQEG